MRVRVVLTLSVVVFSTACSQQALSPLSSLAKPMHAMERPNLAYKVLYSFGASPGDGERPQAGLTYNNGLFVGSTSGGGTHGAGTIFSVRADGSYHSVYAFTGGADGASPRSRMTFAGTYYGTTRSGGGGACHAGCGTVFAMTPMWNLHVLYRFRGGVDGWYPNGGLVEDHGVLYGTTSRGGHDDLGTVFAIHPSGVEEIVYSFKGGSDDGALPETGLTPFKGHLYGTTRFGGEPGCAAISPQLNGCGTIFEILPDGTERVVHRFVPGKDGSTPSSDLVNTNGNLYGTTTYGGMSTRCGTGSPGGCGTLYELARDGAERVVLYFQGGAGGGVPQGDLSASNGVIYGTTRYGGASSGCVMGCGVAYSVTNGKERVLYHFGGGTDGAHPAGGLSFGSNNHELYGTTESGGANGKGTIFEVTP